MELQSITQVSKDFGISTRTLRYYEQIGLIAPSKKEDFSYRVYGAETVDKLRQIIVLRKLRIPLRQVADILQSGDARLAIDAFERNLAEIGDEIVALSTIRDIIRAFIERLNAGNRLALLDDESLLDIVDSLTVSKINFKEDKTMEVLNKASEKLSKLTDRDVRIVYLPPAWVAASHYIGDEPENYAMEMTQKFIKDADLEKVYPASRCFGFNHPNPGMRQDGKYGYEFWATIPDDMEVPAPLEKKRFAGGLYAAYMILGDELNGTGWNRLFKEWMNHHEIWRCNMSSSDENMNDLLEEHLNIFNWGDFQQFDLLLPIKKKEEK